jgi:hypothetical protein
MTDFREKLKRAKLPRRTVEICLAGDQVAEFERLSRELEQASQRPAVDSIEDDGGMLEIAQRIEALRGQMRADTEEFVVQALPGPKYRELKAQHPPRQDDEGAVIDDDRFLDANLETFAEPLLRACLVAPEFDDELWAETVEALTDRQYEDLVNAAIFVNKGSVTVPFSRAASAILSSSAPE